MESSIIIPEGLRHKLSPEARSKIAKAASVSGGVYEVKIAKIISQFFGFSTWRDAFIKTKRSAPGPKKDREEGSGQPHGDIVPVARMAQIWYQIGLGPIECKDREEWSFNQIFKDPANNKVVQYWVKSNTDTKSENSVLVFTKAHMIDFVLHPSDGNQGKAGLLLILDGVDVKLPHRDKVYLVIQPLTSFLQSHWTT